MTLYFVLSSKSLQQRLALSIQLLDSSSTHEIVNYHDIMLIKLTVVSFSRHSSHSIDILMISSNHTNHFLDESSNVNTSRRIHI